MRLYFIRHGETDWNQVKRLQGKSDIPLNEFGEHLAIETGEALKDVRFDLVYTSPLKRARKTAELVAGERDIPILMSQELKRWDLAFMKG